MTMQTYTFFFFDSDGEEVDYETITGYNYRDALEQAEAIAYDYGWTVELGEE